MSIDFLSGGASASSNKDDQQKQTHQDSEIKYYIPKKEETKKTPPVVLPSHILPKTVHGDSKPQKPSAFQRIVAQHTSNPRPHISVSSPQLPSQPVSELPSVPKSTQTKKKVGFFSTLFHRNIKKDSQEKIPTKQKEAHHFFAKKKDPKILYHQPESLITNNVSDVGVNFATKDFLQSKSKVAESRAVIMVFSFVLACFVLAIWYAYITFSGTKTMAQINDYKKQSDDLGLQLSVYQERLSSAVVLQKQLVALTNLVQNHKEWSNVLKFLEKYTVQDVYFTDMVVSEDGEIIFSAIAPNYNAISQQMKSFENGSSQVEEVTVLSANTEERRKVIADLEVIESEVHFDIIIRFNESFISDFYYD